MGKHFLDTIGQYLTLKDVIVLGLGSLATILIERLRDRARERHDNLRAAQHNSFSWESVVEGAEFIGKKLRTFKPDLIITFAGASSIFANLVLVKCLKRSDLLRVRLYTALFIDKGAPTASLITPGFTVLESDRFYVLVPEGLERETKTSRILIIDDTVTSGSSMRAVKAYLESLGYSKDKVVGGCFVCYEGAKLSTTCASDWVYKTAANTDYRLPWGERL